MANLKISLKGSGVDVSKSSGFEPYEGPKPKPGVYAAIVRSVRIRISQAGNPYFNVLFELADQTTGEKQKYKGYPHFEKIVPGESDFQKERVAKLLHLLSGKDPNKVDVNVVHDEVTDGGAVTKVGGKDPVGSKARIVIALGEMYEGERQLRISDLFPWPKGTEWPTGEGFEDEASDDEEELDEEIEDEEPEDEESEEEESDEEEEEEEEEEDEEGEEEEDDEADDEEFEARQAELSSSTRAELKAILKEVAPDFKVLKKHTDTNLVDAILDVEFPVEGDEPPF